MSEDTDNRLVLLIDELPLKRAFITQFLEPWAQLAGLTIVATDFARVVALKREAGCRLVILSLGAERLTDPQVLAAHRVLAAVHPNQPIVALGDRPDTENVERGLQLGLAGYIPTSLEAEVAVAALDFVLAGGRYFPPDALRTIPDQPHGAPPQEPRQLPLLSPASTEPRKPTAPDPLKTNGLGEKSLDRNGPERMTGPIFLPSGNLTSRQQEVLACLQRARSNKEIARELSMSEATVKVHVRQVMKKLGALNRTHAAVLAVNLVGPKEALATNVAPFLTSKGSAQRALMR